jgi:hypothetical protein
MTNMPYDDERTSRVVSAASQLRIPVTPPVDLWPAILARLGSQHRSHRRPLPWITIVVVCLLLFIGTSILASRIASYSKARSRAVMVPLDAVRMRLDRANELSSDHEKAEALIALVESSKHDKDLVNLILMSTRPIGSSFEKANVLVKLGRAGALTTQPLRETYLWVANTISSKFERNRALDALERSLVR